MSKIEENKLAHPEWYVDPSSVSGDVAAVLSWKAKQPFGLSLSGGAGTIGDAWEQAGTGMYYFAHVKDAQQQVSDYYALADRQRADGITPDAPFWTDAPKAEKPAASFGGS